MAMMTRIACLSITFLLASCAWASRNGYEPPTSGDIGTIIVDSTPPNYRITLMISYESGAKGTFKGAGNVETSGWSVRALHQPYIWLIPSIDNFTHFCANEFRVPFPIGNLRIMMSEDNGLCKWQFVTELPNGEWKVTPDVRDLGKPFSSK